MQSFTQVSPTGGAQVSGREVFGLTNLFGITLIYHKELFDKVEIVSVIGNNQAIGRGY